IGNQETARGTKSKTLRIVQLRNCGVSTVAGVAPVAIARHGVNIACGHAVGGRPRYLSDHGVIEIGDEEVAGSIYEDAVGTAQGGAGGRSAVPAVIATLRCTRHGLYQTGSGNHFPNDTVISIGDEEIPGGIDGDTIRVV